MGLSTGRDKPPRSWWHAATEPAAFTVFPALQLYCGINGKGAFAVEKLRMCLGRFLEQKPAGKPPGTRQLCNPCNATLGR